MANVYYEISDIVVDSYGGKYFSRYNCLTTPDNNIVIDFNYKLVMDSIRIWRQDGSEVRFLKNHYIDPKLAIVDPVEFTLIVLKSNPI